MKRLLTAVCIALLSIVFYDGCSDRSVNTPVENKPGRDYKPGVISVVWQDTVKYEFARSFITQLKLEPVRWDFDSSFVIRTLSPLGKEDEKAGLLKKNQAVTKVIQNNLPAEGYTDKSMLIVHFDGTIKPDSAARFINSIAGLSVDEISLRPRYTELKVPTGDEKRWAYIMRTYSFVKFSEPVIITYTF